MQKISTTRTSEKNIFQGQLSIGLDLGDRSSAYCVLNEAGAIVLEHKVATTPEAIKQVFGSMPRCRIAMETEIPVSPDWVEKPERYDLVPTWKVTAFTRTCRGLPLTQSRS